MEGIGSRFGRVSSRYGGSSSGPGPSATVFNGPVRKWKRKWVRSQPNDNVTSGSRGNHNHHHHHHHQENKPTLLLCRWTRLPSTNNSDESPEPTKRKFRYTPVVVLEDRKKEALRKTNGEAETRKQSTPLKDDMVIEKPGPGHANDFNDEIKEVSDDDQASFENLNLQL